MSNMYEQARLGHFSEKTKDWPKKLNDWPVLKIEMASTYQSSRHVQCLRRQQHGNQSNTQELTNLIDRQQDHNYIQIIPLLAFHY